MADTSNLDERSPINLSREERISRIRRLSLFYTVMGLVMAAALAVVVLSLNLPVFVLGAIFVLLVVWLSLVFWSGDVARKRVRAHSATSAMLTAPKIDQTDEIGPSAEMAGGLLFRNEQIDHTVLVGPGTLTIGVGITEYEPSTTSNGCIRLQLLGTKGEIRHEDSGLYSAYLRVMLLSQTRVVIRVVNDGYASLRYELKHQCVDELVRRGR